MCKWPLPGAVTAAVTMLMNRTKGKTACDDGAFMTFKGHHGLISEASRSIR